MKLAAIALSIAMLAIAMPAVAQDYAAIVASSDRSDADRQTDKRRDPVDLLTFTGAKNGWTVLDMGAGAGYSTELMARSVGPVRQGLRAERPGIGEAAAPAWRRR